MNRRYELNGKVASATLISNGKPVLDLGGNFVRSIYKPLNVRITKCILYFTIMVFYVKNMHLYISF